MSINICQDSEQLAKQLVRPELLSLVPYQSARRIGGQGEIWVNANESPFNNTNVDQINRYPECQPPSLIQAYSQYSGVAKENILATRGADEAIELLIRTFCSPAKDRITIFTPTYGMYAISAATNNVAIQALKLDAQMQLPISNELARQITDEDKLIFICNPNNPTGTIQNIDSIKSVLARFPDKLVVIDEAYIEFSSQQSLAPLLAEYANLIVLRTLSKAFALAGARCGFLLANKGIVEMVMRIIAPYPIPLPTANLASQALSPQGISLMQQQVALINQYGKRLTEALANIGIAYFPTQGNFVMAQFPKTEQARKAFVDAGIVTRSYQVPELNHSIRLSFTNEADTQDIIKVILTQIKQQG